MSTAIPTTRSSNQKRTVYDVVADGDYPARIVRFVGLGVQEQPDFKGEKKQPAFKCSIAYELIDVDATGTEYKNDDDKEGTPIDPKPSCQFQDYYLFPGAKRGKVYELCQYIEPGLDAVPQDLEWFMNRLGEIVNVRVGHYVNGKGVKRNKVVSVSAIPTMFKKSVGEARCELVAFNPYKDSPDMMQSYGKLYNFQREILAGAIDAKNIPYAGMEPADNGGQEQKVSGKPVENKLPEAPASNPDEMPFDDDIPF